MCPYPYVLLISNILDMIDYGGMELTGKLFAAQALPLYRKSNVSVVFLDADVSRDLMAFWACSQMASLSSTIGLSLE